jgi:hypothetical protein
VLVIVSFIVTVVVSLGPIMLWIEAARPRSFENTFPYISEKVALNIMAGWVILGAVFGLRPIMGLGGRLIRRLTGINVY